MVSVGQAPPDFKLMDQNSKMVSLSSFKKKKSVVVSNLPVSKAPSFVKTLHVNLYCCTDYCCAHAEEVLCTSTVQFRVLVCI